MTASQAITASARPKVESSSPRQPPFKGKIIAAGGFEPDSAEAVRLKGDADLVAFGPHFVANPDLPMSIRLGLPLNPYDRKTFYTFDSHRYTDCAFLASTLSRSQAA